MQFPQLALFVDPSDGTVGPGVGAAEGAGVGAGDGAGVGNGYLAPAPCSLQPRNWCHSPEKTFQPKQENLSYWGCNLNILHIEHKNRPVHSPTSSDARTERGPAEAPRRITRVGAPDLRGGVPVVQHAVRIRRAPPTSAQGGTARRLMPFGLVVAFRAFKVRSAKMGQRALGGWAVHVCLSFSCFNVGAQQRRKIGDIPIQKEPSSVAVTDNAFRDRGC